MPHEREIALPNVKGLTLASLKSEVLHLSSLAIWSFPKPGLPFWGSLFPIVGTTVVWGLIEAPSCLETTTCPGHFCLRPSPTSALWEHDAPSSQCLRTCRIARRLHQPATRLFRQSTGHDARFAVLIERF